MILYNDTLKLYQTQQCQAEARWARRPLTFTDQRDRGSQPDGDERSGTLPRLEVHHVRFARQAAHAGAEVEPDDAERRGCQAEPGAVGPTIRVLERRVDRAAEVDVVVEDPRAAAAMVTAPRWTLLSSRSWLS